MGLLSGLLGGGDGGIGNSKSQNTTTNLSSQLSGGANSTVTSQSINGSNNTLIDAGAVSGALTLALKGVEGANQLAQQVSSSSSSLLAGALSSATEQQKQFATSIENIKTSDVRVLILAGLAVVGIVGIAVFSRRKGS